MRKLLVAALAALAFPAAALAHANISPPVALSNHDQLFTLVVPNEKDGVATTKVELDYAGSFGAESFLDAPGWTREESKQGVTWSGSTKGDAVFQFVGGSESNGARAIVVKQTYADGTVVSWSGAPGSGTPAPVVEFRSSLGGGGSPTLAVVALVVAALAFVVAVGGLFARGGGGRPLA